MLRRYSDFKLYPNRVQSAALERQRRMHCALYNALLQQRIEAWSRQGESLSYYDQCKELTALRNDPDIGAEWYELSSDSMAATAQRLDRAFQAFFKRAKSGAGAASGFPRFKRGDDYPGFSFKRHGSGWNIEFRDRGVRHGSVYIKGTPGRVKLRGQLPVEPERIKTCELLWRGDQWWLSLVVEMPARRDAGRKALEVYFNLVDDFARIKRANGRRAPGPEAVFWMAYGRITPEYPGVDGTSAAATRDSLGDRGVDGDRGPVGDAAATRDSLGDRGIVSLRLEEPLAAATRGSVGDRGVAAAHRLAAAAAATRDSLAVEHLQQAMSRCKRGSNRYRQLKRRKARLQAKIARRRNDSLHNWTTAIVTDAKDLLVVKPEKIKEATKSGHGNEKNWGAAVETKADFNRHVLDQAPGLAIAMLEYKAEEAGVKIWTLDHAELNVGNEIVNTRKSVRRAKRTVAKEKERLNV